jgi:methylmalonyl-CoA mutase cobalamin-binding subunit
MQLPIRRFKGESGERFAILINRPGFSRHHKTHQPRHTIVARALRDKGVL